MDQFIFGPLIEDNATLFTAIDNEFYYLKPDPRSGYPPYFGRSSQYLNQLALQTTPEPSLSTTSGLGFIQDIALETAVLSTGSSTSKDGFDFIYMNGLTGDRLLYGVPFQMFVNGVGLTFKWKSVEDEQEDPESYSGDVQYYFLAPHNAYDPESSCERFINGPFLAYSNIPEYEKIWYSTIEWCQTDIPFEPCAKCGDCFGPCPPDQECIPDPKTGTLKCRTPGPSTTPWYKQIWFWALIGLVLIIIIILVVFFTVFNK